MQRPEIQLSSNHIYTVNGEKYPNVTQIIDATVPKQLAWWGMQVGCEGIAGLVNGKEIPERFHWSSQSLVDLLKEHKLTTNHRFYKAGNEGSFVHSILNNWTAGSPLPDPSMLSENVRARATGLLTWLLEAEPEVLASERKTASLKYGYAGTLDLIVRPTKGEFKGSVGLLDVKNTKRVYPDSMFPQLAAYRQAESEYDVEVDWMGILHLSPTGKAKLHLSSDTIDDFLVLLAHYNSIQKRKCTGSKRQPIVASL